jgi:hypothetical protein
MVISFCLLLNIASFGLLFLVLANGATNGELFVMATSDANLLFVASLLGLIFNIILGVMLWRGSTRARREEIDARPDRSLP